MKAYYQRYGHSNFCHKVPHGSKQHYADGIGIGAFFSLLFPYQKKTQAPIGLSPLVGNRLMVF